MMPESDAKSRILILDDEADFREALAAFLAREGHDVRGAATAEEVFELLAQQRAQVILADINAAGVDPDSFLRKLRRENAETLPVVVTGYGSIEQAVAATKEGAFDYITKPVVDDEIRLVVERALRQQSLLFDNRALRQQLDGIFGLENIVGRDPQMRRIFEIIEAVADGRTTVLVQGEHGTGKSLLARALHRRSPRRDRPFVEVCCSALPEALLEGELFGHVKGAFAAASTDRPGRLAAAEGGTIFLDDIDAAPPATQLKLLRLLEEHQYEPAGSDRPREIDVRCIFATTANLAPLVAQATFRRDLYYRINVVSLKVPPLRQRLGDVPLLAEHFLGHFRRELGRQVSGFTSEASQILERYEWPGNIRELENAIERAAVLCRKVLIDLGDLPEPIRRASGTFRPAAEHLSALFAGEAMPLRSALELPEKAIIRASLERNAWNRQSTADELQINRTTLYKKMRRYGLDAAPVD